MPGAGAKAGAIMFHPQGDGTRVVVENQHGRPPERVVAGQMGMNRARQWIDTEDDETGANRQTASLAGLAIALFLVVVGLFLIRTLHRQCMEQDCGLQGGTSCQAMINSTP